jgi:hypothetical protein
MTYRALIVRRLALSERNIAEGERRVAAQRALLECAMQQGLRGTAHAAALRRLTEAQAVHLAARDRLRAELQTLDENPRRELRGPTVEAHQARRSHRSY